MGRATGGPKLDVGNGPGIVADSPANVANMGGKSDVQEEWYLGVCPGAGDCCASNGSPGCNDADCCECECAIDPFCCDIEWDGLCAANVCDD